MGNVEENHKYIRPGFKLGIVMNENRQYIRISIVEFITMKEQFRGIVYNGTISNISAGGVQVLTKESIPVDTSLYLTFNLPTGECFKMILSVVVRCDEISDKFYHGIMFLNISFEDQEKINKFVAREHRRRLKILK